MSGISELHNRTLICSVLFVDIVEYSRKPVVEQSRLKDRFNSLLSNALQGVAVNDRIILDTGDGAAISFIGDPEDALFVATALRDLIETSSENGAAVLSTRMGINLGPVRLVKDINGQPNIIGDGINVAQRVMTFAVPGQVLVSRSYYEIVSRLSEESAKLFSYEGARTDKHVREHEVYAVGSHPAMRRRGDSGAHDESGHASRNVRPAGPAPSETTLKDRVLRAAQRPVVATVVAAIVIVTTAFAMRAYREEQIGTQPPAAPPAAAERQASEQSSVAASLPPIRGMPAEPVQSAERKVAEAASTIPPTVPKKAAVKETTKAREKPAPAAPTMQEPSRAAATQQTPAASAPAMLSFAVSPWGEVHVNGKLHGVSPPLQELEVGPGRHRVEIKNGAAQPHVVTVNAKSGEQIRIKHKFE
jgi:class 3 adenylate cyclase